MLKSVLWMQVFIRVVDANVEVCCRYKHSQICCRWRSRMVLWMQILNSSIVAVVCTSVEQNVGTGCPLSGVQ